MKNALNDASGRKTSAHEIHINIENTDVRKTQRHKKSSPIKTYERES